MNAFNHFVKQRLQKRKESPEVLSELKRSYYQEKVLDVIRELKLKIDNKRIINKEIVNKEEFEESLINSGIYMVSIRSAFNQDSKLLKPVATFPQEKLAFAEKIAYQHPPQEFGGYDDALKRIDQRFLPEKSSDGVSIHFSAVYTTRKVDKKRKDEKCFDLRIDKVYSKMLAEYPKELESKSLCFFSVKAKVYQENRQSTQGKAAKRKYRISQIIAIYLRNNIQISQSELEKAHTKCQEIFEESEQIRKIDDELFELEGHELVSSLQPLFLNEEVAPADKITFSVEKLKQLLHRHLDSHYPTVNTNHIEVYFVSLAYEVLDDSKPNELYPTFQVYPHVYRRELSYPSFVIGHRQRVSISKYLLRNYFKYYQEKDNFEFVTQSNIDDTDLGVRIANAFMKELFEYIDNIVEEENAFDRFISSSQDQLFISRKLKNLDNSTNRRKADEQVDRIWDELNVEVNSDSGEQDIVVNSLLAYVIEGHKIDEYDKKRNDVETHYQQLPRAILAIESNQRELLSDRERDSLQVVAKAFSHLIRHLFHTNTLLDYRVQLSKAYERYAHNSMSDENQGRAIRFILASMSIDVDLLSRILDAAEKKNDFSSQIISEMREIFNEVFAGTGIDDDEIKESKVVKDKINWRFEKAVEFVQEPNNENLLNQSVIDFLEACPRNFAWAGYAPSLAQALGDRAGNLLPRFEIMLPGFSAAALYMALVKSEIRQVAKLSNLSKLKQERDNYRKYVRYKLLVAAREPRNAFAFDSTGKDGFICGRDKNSFVPEPDYGDRCYGVLVADLASARKLELKKTQGEETLKDEKVITFLRMVTMAVEDKDPKSVNSIVDSIQNLFINNLGHWYNTPDSEDIKEETILAFLINGFRFYEKDKKDNEEIIEMAESIRIIRQSFVHLLDGNPDSPVSHEKGTFPFKEFSLLPDQVASFIHYNYSEYIELQNIKNCYQLLSIAHRDLNARNLVWAGPIETFMLIDFEHVGIGLWGMDQARLAVNTVVDFMSEVDISSDSSIQVFAETVDNAANFIVNLWTTYRLSEKTVKNYLSNFRYVNRNEEPALENEHQGYARWKRDPKQILKGIVQFIFRTTWRIDEKSDDSHLLNQHFFGAFQACLGFSVVKEYEYSIVNVRRLELKPDEINQVKEIIDRNKKSLKSQLIDIYNYSFSDKHTLKNKEKFGKISRYLVAYWMLRSIFAHINFSTESKE
jgi:hypothetical protein